MQADGPNFGQIILPYLVLPIISRLFGGNISHGLSGIVLETKCRTLLPNKSFFANLAFML
jgi:hypothetical protein